MVIDTMLFVYAALNVRPFRDESYAVLSRASDVIVPESMLAELLNAAWQHTRSSGVSLADADGAMDDALDYVDRRAPIDVLWHDALRLAVAAGHSPYDTLSLRHIVPTTHCSSPLPSGRERRSRPTMRNC